MIKGRYRQQLTKHKFNETMSVHDSYRETFTSWAVTTKEAKVRGVTIMKNYLLAKSEKTKFNCNCSLVKWT